MPRLCPMKDIKIEDIGWVVHISKSSKKLRTAIDFNSEIIDFNEKLQAENLEYSEREKDIGNNISADY